MRTGRRWPWSMALLAWILGQAGTIGTSPRLRASWQEIFLVWRGDLPAWRTRLAWGPGSRWLDAARNGRQVFEDGCGAAALQPLLRAQGRSVPQTLLWSLTRLPGGGTTLPRMRQIAARFGVPCRVHPLPPSLGGSAPGITGTAPMVLHLKRSHFVVLLQLSAARATLLDPALGRVAVTHPTLRRRASGWALTCGPPAGATPRRVAAPPPGRCGGPLP